MAIDTNYPKDNDFRAKLECVRCHVCFEAEVMTGGRDISGNEEVRRSERRVWQQHGRAGLMISH